MFTYRGRGIAMPQHKSLWGALSVTVLAMVGSHISAMIGYVLALLTLVMIIVATHVQSIWPTNARKENPLVFSVFWGLMIGTIAPFILTTFWAGGVSAVWEIFAAHP
jgi:hypothetical protein